MAARLFRCLSTLALASAVLAAACAPSASTSEDPPADVGSVSASLDIGPGMTIASVGYTVSGPGGFTRTGTIDVSHSTSFAALVSGLPAGNGYTITLSATTTDGHTSCGGSGMFNVAAHMTSVVMIHLSCHEASQLGSVLVNGTLNICPVADGLAASPQETIVGTAIHLAGSAHDSDAGPAALTYAWTATSGVFDDAAAPNPLFTCTVSGPVTVTLTVTDGDLSPTCADHLSVPLKCTDAPAHP